MLRFAETDRLDRLAQRAAVMGALVAAVASLLPPPASMLWMGPFALLAGTAATRREAVKGVALALGALLPVATFVGYPLFARALSGAVIAYGLTRTVEEKRKVAVGASMALGAIVWPMAMDGLTALGLYAFMQSLLPPVILYALAGGVTGLAMGLTTMPIYVQLGGDAVEAAVGKMQPTLDADLRSLVLRILETRRRALRLLEESRAAPRVRMETTKGLDAVAVTSIELTNRFSVVDRVLSRSSLTEIDGRLATLREQLEAAKDEGVRLDLQRTEKTLSEQRQQLERLIQARARLTARLQSEHAALEKAEMAFALLAAGDAALAGIQLEAIGNGLGAQAHELEAEGTALQELLTVPARQVMEQLRR